MIMMDIYCRMGKYVEVIKKFVDWPTCSLLNPKRQHFSTSSHTPSSQATVMFIYSEKSLYMHEHLLSTVHIISFNCSLKL